MRDTPVTHILVDEILPGHIMAFDYTDDDGYVGEMMYFEVISVKSVSRESGALSINYHRVDGPYGHRIPDESDREWYVSLDATIPICTDEDEVPL